MTGLFVRLYFDEDLSAQVAEMVRARGFDVLTTLAAGRLGSSDDAQLEFAAAEGRTLVTHNRKHFERLATTYFETHLTHSGIILAVRRSPRDLAGRLLGVSNRVTQDEMSDQILYL